MSAIVVGSTTRTHEHISLFLHRTRKLRPAMVHGVPPEQRTSHSLLHGSASIITNSASYLSVHYFPFASLFMLSRTCLSLKRSEGFDLDSRMHRGTEKEYIQSLLQGGREVVSRTARS